MRQTRHVLVLSLLVVLVIAAMIASSYIMHPDLPEVQVEDVIGVTTSEDVETGEVYTGSFTVVEVKGGELRGRLALEAPEGWELRGFSTPTNQKPHYEAVWADAELASGTNEMTEEDGETPWTYWRFESLTPVEESLRVYKLVVQGYEQ